MKKRLTLQVPKYLKKFLEGEFKGQNGEIHVEKWSELGKLIHLVSRSYPFPIAPVRAGGNTISISYYCREKSFEVPPDKMHALGNQLEEIFRRSLICEVRKVHEMAGGNYGPYIRQFLERYGIEPDVDVDFETIRKIYRDYLARNGRENEKNICVKSPAFA
ncbi:hypothetical protein F5984_19850 [Rudanella paleaurantiibacter]|uniref:Uncharacterized protein n=1 Tax=Rudanella paleaurantiibacter TaxID=2614655 RepID=A0A7J5TV32_9BACT|nr:hypothetical protein [Rudanella paleaurantiibacter]KAB7728011.1 hypothetical protein F5984_19850 [Rudanella paleaurantiibacter]